MRNTPLLETVLKIFTDQHRPISVPELQALLKEQNLEPNKTTLYRLLERLESNGKIDTVLLDSRTTYYEKADHHHHHFVCENCDEIQCISDQDLEEKIHQLEDQLKASGLKIKQHQFSFSGCCKSCQ